MNPAPVSFMFAYGMNTNLTSMMLRCRNAKCLGKAYLPDHTLQFRYHLDIAPSKFDVVQGVLWQLDYEDFKVIDQLEGYPDYYSRYIYQPYIDNYTNTFPAWTYAMWNKDSFEYPDERYLDLVIEGYRQNDIDVQQLNNALQQVEKYKQETM
jgi:gamma-glutamylcyclotransferase (GGCT)/AIG2-like uncharacterized protein YtfP